MLTCHLGECIQPTAQCSTGPNEPVCTPKSSLSPPTHAPTHTPTHPSPTPGSRRLQDIEFLKAQTSAVPASVKVQLNLTFVPAFFVLQKACLGYGFGGGRGTYWGAQVLDGWSGVPSGRCASAAGNRALAEGGTLTGTGRLMGWHARSGPHLGPREMLAWPICCPGAV